MTRKLLSYGLWPTTVLAGTALLIAGYQNDLWIPAIVALPTLLLFGLYGLEHVIPAVPGESAHEDSQRGNDIGHLVFNAAVGEALGNSFLRIVAAAIAAALPAAFDLWPHTWPMAAQVTLLIVSAEFLEYWRHRLVHRQPLLWRAHELHHSGTHLNVLKSSRNHMLDLFMRTAMVYTPLVLLGVPALWIPIYAGAILVVGPLAHANLNLRFPRWLHYVISTPHVHAIHHARDETLADRNFASLPLFDLAFGTFEHPEGHRRPAAGVAGPQPPTGFLAQVLEPFRSRRQQPANLGMSTPRAAT